MTGHSGGVTSLAFHPDGRILASGDDSGGVYLWDIASGAKMGSYQGHTSAITSLSYSQEGTLLASASTDNTVRVWKGSANKGSTSSKATSPSEELLGTYPTK